MYYIPDSKLSGVLAIDLANSNSNNNNNNNNRGRPLKRLLDTRDRNGSTSGLTPWQTYYDDDDDDDNNNLLQINNYIRKLRRVGVLFLNNTTKHEISIKMGRINYN